MMNWFMMPMALPWWSLTLTRVLGKNSAKQDVIVDKCWGTHIHTSWLPLPGIPATE